jgi:hypothetical protein
MSRLQILIPPDLDAELRKSPQRQGISTGEFVRRAIRKSLPQLTSNHQDPVASLASLAAPTGDIEQMLDEIERGRF